MKGSDAPGRVTLIRSWSSRSKALLIVFSSPVEMFAAFSIANWIGIAGPPGLASVGSPSTQLDITSEQNAVKQSTDRAAPSEVAFEATVAEPEHAAGRVLERSVR
jgi:hypothetical protein